MGNEMKTLRHRPNRQGVQLARRRMSQARRSVSRGLFAERLEDRRLLSGAETPYHNSMVPIDVTRDWVISPRDALTVINELNNGGARVLDTSSGSNDANRTFIDTNGDNILSPIDALRVINALNSGDGLDAIVGFRLELQDSTGAKIQPLKDGSGNVILDTDGDPILPVRVGDQFRVQIFVDDLRPTAGANGGVFAATIDVGYNDPSLFSLNGTKPDAFTNLTQFESFFTTSSFYSQPALDVYPSALNIDGDGVPNEYDELKTFAPSLAAHGADEKPFVYVTMKADSVGKLTLAANKSDESPPLSDILLFGEDTPVDVTAVDFGFPLHVTVIQMVNAENDAFPVAPNVIWEDVSSVNLDVLQNDFRYGTTVKPTLDPAGLTQPANGAVAVVGGLIRYTPVANFFGTDTFIYRAIDGLGNSDTATVTVTVTSVNDAPQAVNDTVTGILEDSGANTIDVLVNDNGGPPNEDQSLTIDDDSVTVPAHGTVTVAADKKSVQYTPVGNYFGGDSFQYAVLDSDGRESGLATVSITVDNVNDPPIAQNDQATGILEDSSNNAINVLANDSPGPNESSVDALTIVSVQNFSQGGSATISGSSVLYKPLANFFGTETFTYTVRDNGGWTATATVTVTVTNVNDPPIAQDDVVYVDEFTTNNQLFLLADNGNGPDKPGPDNEIPIDNLTITAVTIPSSGGAVTIAPDGKSVFYTPNAVMYGLYTETFTYTMSDGQYSDTATVTVNVEPVIRPRARNDVYTVLEDSGANVLNQPQGVLANDLFNEGFTHSLFVITTPPSHGTADIVGENIVYTPAPDFFGTDTLVYQIDDDFVDPNLNPSVPSSATVTITVTGVNDPPKANGDIFSGILEDSSNNQLDVLANDSILPDAGETLTITKVGSNGPMGDNGQTSQGGTVTILAGKVLYTPKANFFGTDTFTYTISDGNGGTDSATVTVEVNNLNDNPTANADQFGGILEDSTDNELDVLANDSILPDVGETLTIVSVGANTAGNNGQTAQGGTLTISAGKVLYTPKANFFGTDTFTYAISDGNGGSSRATVTVVVDDVNDNPTANDDQLMALKDFTDQVLDVLPNDSIAPDFNEVLTIIGLGPQDLATLKTPHGTATISQDAKKIIYTPDPGFETVGSDFDTFTYTISDGRGGTDVGNVVVDVIDAVPSDISGVIYLDVNNNGVQDPGELTVAGVTVTLTGTNLRGEVMNREVTTDADGVFIFASILPNAAEDLVGYSIQASTPKFLIDGKDSIVDGNEVGGPDYDAGYDPGVAGNDVFTGIDLGLYGNWKTEGNYAFGERGLSSRYITLAQYLSSARKGLLVATKLDSNPNDQVDELGEFLQSDDFFFVVQQGWEGVTSAHAQLVRDPATGQLTSALLTVNGVTKSISYKKFYLAGDSTTGEYMIYFNGSAADLGFLLSANGGDDGAEGEAVEMYEADYAQGADEVFASGEWA
jgi:hypothetical protein